MKTQIRTEWEGRMGNNLTKVYIIVVDGREVGFSKRRWLARAITAAIEAGHIKPEGDTTSAFAQWASVNAREVFERLHRSGE